MRIFGLVSLLLLSSVVQAQEFMIISKSHNPKNVLHYKLATSDCKIATPAIIPFWVMGEEDGHTEGLSNSEKSYFQPKISYQKEQELDFSIGAMDRLGNKLPNKTIRVRLEDCKPRAYATLGGREIKIDEIYVHIKMLSVRYITITGTGPDGNKVTFRIDN